jgi:uncharacterized protein (DUF433 family)
MLYGPVSIDPEVMSGTPVFVGTRVPIQNLFDYIEGGDNLSEFLDDFPSVTREAVISVLEMAKKALTSEKQLKRIFADEV